MINSESQYTNVERGIVMQVEHLSFDYGDKTIFKDVSFIVSRGEKAGLVGANGAGKTTFFKIVLGMLLPSEGTITFKKDTKIEWLPQIIAEDHKQSEMTVREYILSARPISQLEKRLDEVYTQIGLTEDENNQIKLSKEAENIQAKLETLDWYEHESIMLNIAYNMKITDAMLYMKMKELSGGQKSKVAFARLLYSKQDVMLLDEPTNHLDNETKKFVIEFLKSYKGTVLIISHDVSFLNEVTNVTLFFDARTQKIIRYNGNYSVFEKQHEEYEARLQTMAKKQDEEIERLEGFINKFEGTSGKRKRQAQDREKKLERILQERVIVQPEKRQVDFKMEKIRTENDIPIAIRRVTFRYPGTRKNIIANLSVEIAKQERFLIVGANGAGKSTLLKLIARELKSNEGQIVVGSKVDIGYYAQEHENLMLDKTILENFAEFNVSERKLRSKLAHFLFYGEDVNKTVSVLSPGERARVALAKLAMSGSNTILIDEPTNHLDPETQIIIARVFKEFAGTMIVVSHNPSFVEELGIERMLVLPEGRIEEYNRKTVEKFYKINTRVLDKKK